MISAIILTKNNEDKISDAIHSLKNLVEEIIVVDTGSTDNTIKIATSFGAKIIKISGGGYSEWRNKGAEASNGDWILYLDSDERLTSELSHEILQISKGSLHNVFAIPRENIILGKIMKHGGEWPDYQIRLFSKPSKFIWKGDLHETPVFKGTLGHLINPMIHLKHDNVSDMVTKTNKWSTLEAKLLFDAKHPPVVWWRFIRIMLSEAYLRLIVKKGFMDGAEGIIYSLYQSWSKFLTYAKLAEMQKTK